MNILVINHYAGGPGMGMEHRPWYLAKEWIGTGHKVTIVAADFAHTRTHQPENYTKNSTTEIDGVPYLFIRTPEYKGNGVARVFNMMAFLTGLYSLASHISRRFKPDVVIASSTYPLDIWPARKIARKTGAKLVYEVHDLWPLSPIELGGYSPHHAFIRILQRAENFAYRHSDKVVSILPHTLQHMVEHGLSPEKFIHIPNGVVISATDELPELPDEHGSLIKNIREKGHKIVGYTGSHGIANALEPFIDAADYLRDMPVSFVLVGSGNEKDNLIERASKASLENIHFCDNVPVKTLPALLRNIDILYLGFHRHPLYRFGVSPNKLFDYMLSGRPIIQGLEAGNNPVKDAGCGIAIEPGNPEAIAQAVVNLMNTPEPELLRMGDAGIRYVTKHHNYSVLAREFADSLVH